jgi:hypothetical protein
MVWHPTRGYKLQNYWYIVSQNCLTRVCHLIDIALIIILIVVGQLFNFTFVNDPLKPGAQATWFNPSITGVWIHQSQFLDKIVPLINPF